MLPLVSTAWVWMPCGETQRIAFRSKLNELRSRGTPVDLGEAEFLVVGARHQHVHLLLDEVDGRGALRLRRAAGGVVGTQFDAGMKLPVGSVSVLLTMRFSAGKLRSV